MIKLHFLIENRASLPGCFAEHGLSILIETGERKILFDAGATELFLQNAAQMNVNLEEADTVVVSHGHYDHTGGIPAFCCINKKAGIYIHKDSFERVYGIENGKLEAETSGIRWTLSQFDGIRERLVFTDGVTKLTENIILSGTIPDLEGYAPTERFYIKSEDGNLTVDPMNHEQFLAVRDFDEGGSSKGIYVFSGCSHKGIVPCLRYAKQLFPDEKIAGFIAGMHLYHAGKDAIRIACQQLTDEGVDRIIPVHCTGIQAICYLSNLLGERCIAAGAGDHIEL